MFTNATVNEYLWSSLVTFIAAFGTAITPFLGSLSWNQAAVIALIAVGVRAGFRAVLNLLTTKFNTVSSTPTA